MKVHSNTIAYIDLDLLLKNSNFGKKILQKLQDEKKIKLNELKKRENEIKKKDNDINSKKNIIAENELKIEIIKLQNDIQSFEIYKNTILNDYEDLKNTEIFNFFKEINPYIQEYLSNNSIDILFNNKNIIIGKDNLDITEKIITIINKEIN